MMERAAAVVQAGSCATFEDEDDDEGRGRVRP